MPYKQAWVMSDVKLTTLSLSRIKTAPWASALVCRRSWFCELQHALSAQIKGEVKQEECEIWVVIAYRLLASRFSGDSFGFMGFKHFWAFAPKILFGAPKARVFIFYNAYVGQTFIGHWHQVPNCFSCNYMPQEVLKFLLWCTIVFSLA
jgi:hypothetical protein